MPAVTARREPIALSKQRGVVLILFTLGMVAMLGMAGMALDVSHGMLNKTRLQNITDASALTAAKTLDLLEDPILAEQDALELFKQNGFAPGHTIIGNSYERGEFQVDVEFSATLHPFVPGSVPEEYVRVTARNFQQAGWFIPIVGVDSLTIGASAVAGPSPSLNTACNIAPMMVCGEPGADNYGFELGQADVLKASENTSPVGPGNFQLIRLNGGKGGNDLRSSAAGAFEGCLSMGDTIDTEPGNTVGPTVQGLNTRFGEYTGPMNGYRTDYPPDVIVEEPTPRLTYECDAAGGSGSDAICVGNRPLEDDVGYFDYSEYQKALTTQNFDYSPIEDGGYGAFNRRMLAVPIGDCDGAKGGQTQIPLLGFLCYHLIQTVEQKGNEAHVYGQFVGTGCTTTGRPGPLPGSGPGPYMIQLYKDESAQAS